MLVEEKEGLQEPQIRMQKWCRSLQKRYWNRIDTYVRSVTRDFRGTKTYRCIEEGIRCHGSCSKEKPQLSESAFSFAQSLLVFTMTLATPWEISLVLKSTSVGNTVIISNGSVRNALKAMQFSLTIKLILKLVVPVAILVIVAAFFRGWKASLSTKMLVAWEGSDVNHNLYIHLAFLAQLRVLLARQATLISAQHHGLVHC